MAIKNQHTGGTLRRKRLPTIAVSEMERNALEDMAKAQRMSLAQVVRCGLVLLGALGVESLDDIPAQVAERISSGKPLAPVRAK